MTRPKTTPTSPNGPPNWHRLLHGLVNLDRVSVRAYDQALHLLSPLNEMSLEEIRQRFLSFREDHSRHLRELNELLGLQSATGVLRMVHSGIEVVNESVPFDLLRFVHGHECETGHHYSQSINWDIEHLAETLGHSAERAGEILARCRADERRHVDYIERVLMEITPRSPRGSSWAKRAA